jgi:hypothetical protein
MLLYINAPDASSQGVIPLAPCMVDTWRVRGVPFHATMRRVGGIELHRGYGGHAARQRGGPGHWRSQHILA